MGELRPFWQERGIAGIILPAPPKRKTGGAGALGRRARAELVLMPAVLLGEMLVARGIDGQSAANPFCTFSKAACISAAEAYRCAGSGWQAFKMTAFKARKSVATLFSTNVAESSGKNPVLRPVPSTYSTM